MKRPIMALGVLALAAAGCGRPPPITATVRLPATHFRLANGLDVILHEDHHSPSVAVNLWYHVGSKDDPATKSGMAHLFEHLMFQGSKHVGEDMFIQYLDAAGATERNGDTTADRTRYYETMPKNQLELALWLESDRMAFLLDHVTQAVLDEQRQVVKNEWRQHYENEPYGRVHEFISDALFPPAHPYHRLTIGSPDDLDRVTLDDVRGFDRLYYVPNNATLVLAGDLDRASATELVNKYFGSIAAGTLAVPRGPSPATVSIEREKDLVVEANVEFPEVIVTWPTPPALYEGDEALKIATWGLRNGIAGVLVDNRKVATHVWVTQRSGMLASRFDIEARLAVGQRPEDAVALIDAYVDRFRATNWTVETYDRPRSGIVMDHVFGIESLGGRADTLNWYNQATGDPVFLGKELAHLDGVLAGDVRDAVRTYLVPGRRVVTFVHPNPNAPHSGRLVSAS